MGSSISKSPLERRNTIIRRSQKKVIVQTNSQIEKLLKEIRKFKGVEEDESYKHLKYKIEQHRRDLAKKPKDMNETVQVLHSRALEKLCQAEQLLDSKLKENIEKAKAGSIKRSKIKQKNKKKEDDSDSDDEDTNFGDQESNNNMNEATMDDLEKQRDGAISPSSNRSFFSESNSILSSNDKRNTVELTFVKVEQADVSAHVEKTPQEKRKSILKYGIQVLPSPNNDVTPNHSAAETKSPRSSLPSSPKSNKVEFAPGDQTKLLADITRQVGLIEEEISQFEGKKNEMRYNNLKEGLFSNLDELSKFEDKSDQSYVQLKRYIESCLSFLDEKADANDYDEVFLPDTPRTVNGYKITQI